MVAPMIRYNLRGGVGMARGIVLWSCFGIMCLLMNGCDGKSRLPKGAATLNELISLYKTAHIERDVDKVQPLLWDAPIESVEAVFEYPIADVVYDQFPPQHPTVGGAARYWWPGGLPGGRDNEEYWDVVVGGIVGKLLLLKEPSDDVHESEQLDPGYIVGEIQGRFYITVPARVLDDAARAVKTRTPVNYAAVPYDEGDDIYPNSVLLWKPSDELRRQWLEQHKQE
jgi:hypothetical protein